MEKSLSRKPSTRTVHFCTSQNVFIEPNHNNSPFSLGLDIEDDDHEEEEIDPPPPPPSPPLPKDSVFYLPQGVEYNNNNNNSNKIIMDKNQQVSYTTKIPEYLFHSSTNNSSNEKKENILSLNRVGSGVGGVGNYFEPFSSSSSTNKSYIPNINFTNTMNTLNTTTTANASNTTTNPRVVVASPGLYYPKVTQSRHRYRAKHAVLNQQARLLKMGIRIHEETANQLLAEIYQGFSTHSTRMAVLTAAKDAQAAREIFNEDNTNNNINYNYNHNHNTNTTTNMENNHPYQNSNNNNIPNNYNNYHSNGLYPITQ